MNVAVTVKGLLTVRLEVVSVTFGAVMSLVTVKVLDFSLGLPAASLKEAASTHTVTFSASSGSNLTLKV